MASRRRPSVPTGVVPRAALLQGAARRPVRGVVDAAAGGPDRRRQVGAPSNGAREGVPLDRHGEAGRLAHLQAHGDLAAVVAGPRRRDPEPPLAHVDQGGVGVHLRGRRRHRARLSGPAALLRWGGRLIVAGCVYGAAETTRGRATTAADAEGMGELGLLGGRGSRTRAIDVENVRTTDDAD
jgi:hypothetical protein